MSVSDHARKNVVAYAIGLFLLFAQGIEYLGKGSTAVAAIATKADITEVVDSRLESHQNGVHAVSDSRMKSMDSKLDMILADTQSDKIDGILKVICENPQLRPRLISGVLDREQEYHRLTGNRYDRPTCLDLGIVG